MSGLKLTLSHCLMVSLILRLGSKALACTWMHFEKFVFLRLCVK